MSSHFFRQTREVRGEAHYWATRLYLDPDADHARPKESPRQL